MELFTDAVEWLNTSRLSVILSIVALAGVWYSAQSARASRRQAKSSDEAASAAKEQAKLAQEQARIAREQVDLGRQQIDLLLRQIEQAEKAEEHTRRAHRESLEPVIIVDIAPGINDPGVFVLSIANIGQSVARNVRIKAPDEMLRSDGTKMHEWTVFTNGIKTMPPGHRMQYFFDVGFEPFKSGSPLQYSFTVDCDGPFGPVTQSEYVVDLAPYEGSWAAPTTLHSVVRQLEKVSGTLQSIGNTISKQQVAHQATMEQSLAETSEMNSQWTTWKPIQ